MKLFFWFLIISFTLLTTVFVVLPLWKATASRKAAIIFSISICSVALSLYCYLGASKKLFHTWALEKETIQTQNKLKTFPNSQQLINQLTTHLQKKPDSAQGWYLLGRLYLGNQQYKEAESVLKKAYQLQPHNEDYSVNFVTASYFTHHQTLTPAMLKLLGNVIEHSPNNIDALNLLAINAYQQGHYQQAITYWQQLIPLFTRDSTDQLMVKEMINKAQRQIANN